MDLKIRPKQIFYYLLAIILVMLVFSILSSIIKVLNIENGVVKIFHLFNFDGESNLPTYYSGITLLFSSLMLFIIAIKFKNTDQYYYWLGLSLIFVFISFDELSQIHERISFLLQNLLHTSGILFFAWIIPYSLLLFIVGVLYIKFLFRLPKETLKLFIISTLIFIGGVLSLEMVEGYFADLYGYDTIFHHVATTLEELLEMIGVAVFIYALLDYIKNQIGIVNISVSGIK